MNIQQTPEKQPTQPTSQPISSQGSSSMSSARSWLGKISSLFTSCFPSSHLDEHSPIVNLNSSKLTKIESGNEPEEMVGQAVHEVKENSISRESKEEPEMLTENDFAAINQMIDAHIAKHGMPHRSFEYESLYQKSQDHLHDRSDFKTAQGAEATKKTFLTSSGLVAFVARAKDFVIEKFLAGALPPREQFLKIMDAIDVCLDEADLNDPKECKFLNDLAGLLHKGFNPDTGGIGCLHDKGGWNKSWNELGNGKNTTTSFSKDNVHNGEVMQSFRKMLAYYQESAGSHFSPERHEGGRILAALQTIGTVGQLLNDFAFNEAYPKDIRTVLEKKMVDNGLVHPSLTSQDDEFEQRVEETKNIMRSNPLLAEVKNENVSAEIVTQLKSDELSEELTSIIENQLNAIDPENKMTKEEKKEISHLILGNLIKIIENIRPNATMSGNRGRLPFLPALGPIGKDLAGTPGKSSSLAVSPHRSHDQLSDEWTKKTLGEDDSQIREFYKAVEEDNILKHGFSPTVSLRLGSGLDTHFVRILDPKAYFLRAIQATITNRPESKELLEKFSSSIELPEFKAEYRNFIGKMRITFNQATKQKLTFEEFASMSSVASIMYKNDVRTICSISGTTVDMSLATTLAIGEEKAKQLLQPLLDHLEGKEPDPLHTPEGIKFREFASSIAFFMQAGQYHTAGEVLGGLFIAARSLCSTEEERTNIKETYALFEKLMQEFSADPNKFFAVDPEDEAKIQQGAQQFSQELQKQELERIRSKQQAIK